MNTIITMIFSLSLLVVTTFTQAETFSRGQFQEAGIERRAPQIFIVNKDGVLIHHNFKVFRGLKKSFDKTEPIDSSKAMLDSITRLLGVKPDYSSQDFTVFSVDYDNSILPNGCPPCKQQDRITSKVLEKITEQGTTVSLTKLYISQ